jgi:hypothetical protein
LDGTLRTDLDAFSALLPDCDAVSLTDASAEFGGGCDSALSNVALTFTFNDGPSLLVGKAASKKNSCNPPNIIDASVQVKISPGPLISQANFHLIAPGPVSRCTDNFGPVPVQGGTDDLTKQSVPIQ